MASVNSTLASGDTDRLTTSSISLMTPADGLTESPLTPAATVSADSSLATTGLTTPAAFLPWDNPGNVMSHATYLAIEDAFNCYVLPVLCFVGVSGNVLNCVVFFRQGLRERMNLYIFCLAATDLLFVVLRSMVSSYCIVESLHLQGLQEGWKWIVRR